MKWIKDPDKTASEEQEELQEHLLEDMDMEIK